MRISRILLGSLILILLTPIISAQPDYSDKELAEKFAPKVELHPEEPYEPINAEWFIRNSQLKKSTDGLLSTDKTITKSASVRTLEEYDSEEYYLNLPDEYYESYNQHDSGAEKTVYYSVKDVDDGKILQYWFFYPYSEYSQDVLGIATGHESDWEMAQFYLSEENYFFPLQSGYAQHYIGGRSHWTQQEKSSTSPTVYPSYLGHATYYEPGYHSLACLGGSIDKKGSKTDCTGGESAGGGSTITPDNYRLEELEEQDWIGWNGKWGESLHSGPKGKTDYHGNNVWNDPAQWLDERRPYNQGALQSDYTPPAADLSKPQEVNPDEEVTFTGTGSDNQNYLEYHWEIEDKYYRKTQSSDLTYSFEKGGDYNVEISVVDNEGASTSKEILYHVNQYPLPEFSLLQSTVKTFEDVSIDESSSDPDGVISERIWHFGRQEATGSNPQILFEDDGTYEINLTVIDDDDLGNSVTKKVSVLNRKPNVDVSVNPDQIYYDTQAQFISESSDKDGRITKTTWYIDGQKYSESESFEKTFSNATGGVSTYQVELMVEDDDDDRNSTTRTIEIANRDPSSDFKMNASEVKVGEPIEIGSQAYDEDGNITGLSWNLGDGASKQSKEFTYSYENPGTYEVELTVTDSAGVKSSTIKEIEVNKEGLLEGITGSGSESGDQESSGVVESVINSIIGIFS